MKKALFVLLTALPLAAFSAEGMSDDLKRFFSGLTAAERDNLGREVAREMQQENMNKNMDAQYSHIHVIDIRYRASDDTLVYTLMLKKISSPEVFNAVQRRKLDVTLHKEGRKEVCRNRNMRDLMIHGRYSVEYRVLARNGRALSSPIHISARDC